MLAYWSRILAAWVLLRIASSVVKDAEGLVRAASQKTEIPPREPVTVVEGNAT